jgi:hypothetical protein
MKLTKKALRKISNPSSIGKLMIGLEFTELWIKRLIDANKNNGPLTTYKALEIIRQETDLTNDEILERPKVKASLKQVA